MPMNLRWWQIPFLLLLVAAIIGLVALLNNWRTPETLITIAPLPTEAVSVTVYVGGAVVRPGLYTLPNGERVEAALMAAGGVTDEADPDGLNRAARLRDEAQIVVPKREQPTAAPVHQLATTPPPSVGTARATAPAPASGRPINVNNAGVDELERLPGVGPKLAQAIIEYRLAHGPFATALDLAQVQGISERMALTWESLLTFGP
jgi:competence protein ComEA